jgi:quercetin dioxygenase-like cupin family protein
MEPEYVWNIRKIVENNPIPDDKKLTRTFLVNGKHCTGLIVQAQPQTEPFIHIHKEHEEFLYILEGEGLAYVGEKTFQVKPGDFVYCPAGVKHGFFMRVKGLRLSIYGPPFDTEHSDRIPVNGKDLV